MPCLYWPTSTDAAAGRVLNIARTLPISWLGKIDIHVFVNSKADHLGPVFARL